MLGEHRSTSCAAMVRHVAHKWTRKRKGNADMMLLKEADAQRQVETRTVHVPRYHEESTEHCYRYNGNIVLIQELLEKKVNDLDHL